MQRTLRLFPSADLVSLPKSANRILRSPLAEATHVAQIYRRAVSAFDGDAIRWQFFEEKKNGANTTRADFNRPEDNSAPELNGSRN